MIRYPFKGRLSLALELRRTRYGLHLHIFLGLGKALLYGMY